MATTRCPDCGAMLRVGAEWCPQCYTDLRAAEPPNSTAAEPLDGTAAEPTAAEPRRRRADSEKVAPPGWPCACGTMNDLAADVCAGCGSGFLAPLAEDRGIPVVPGLGSLSRGGRLAATLAGLVVLLGLVTGVLWLLS